jgi:hypothetical protein
MTGARKEVPDSTFKHDLRGWLSAFAKRLDRNSNLSPLAALTSKSKDVNLFFVVFTLYWYRVPGDTRHELSVSKAKRGMVQLAKTIRHLSRNATELRGLHEELRFKDPFGYQIRERLAAAGLAGEPGSRFLPIASTLDEASRNLAVISDGLKDIASLKRNARVSLEVLLWTHLKSTVGLSHTRRFLPLLVYAADAAFGRETTVEVAEAVEQAVVRHKKLFPAEYRRLHDRALRNRKELSSNELRYWNSLPQNCDVIANYLDELFEKEIADSLDASRYLPHETAQK